jgi:hypothetical protein
LSISGPYLPHHFPLWASFVGIVTVDVLRDGAVIYRWLLIGFETVTRERGLPIGSSYEISLGAV